MSPAACPVRTECDVSITGSFPHAPNVWFGDVVVPANRVSWSPRALHLTVPATVNAQTVDVALRDHDVFLVLPAGFTFYDPDAPTGPGDPGSGGTQPAPPMTAPAVTTSTTTTTTTTAVRRDVRRRQPLVLGDATDRNGLTVAPITSGNPLARLDTDRVMCRAVACNGVRL